MASEKRRKSLKQYLRTGEFRQKLNAWHPKLQVLFARVKSFFQHQAGERSRDRWKRIAILLVVVFVIIRLLRGCIPQPEPIYPAPQVVVQSPIAKMITNYVTQTGTLVAFNSVDLVARVEGFLDKIDFVDGAFVKKGQLLFIIEPQPYLDQLKEAKDAVISDQATYEYDKIEYARQQRMYKQNATSLNSVQQWETKVQKSKAELDKAKANEDSTAITYSYTHVLSPFDGRIGRHLIDVGNLVGNGTATKLATVEQIDPIYVYFNLNELDLIKLRASAKQHGIKPEDLSDIPVYASLQDRTDFSHEGRLNFVNTGLNSSTGTLEFRALLPNKNFELLPGLFVQVRVPLGAPQRQLTVPTTAVQYDQIGAYVMVVNQQKIVEIRRVITGTKDDESISVIKGLKEQDKVIISGLQNASPGNPVAPITREN